jgi:hypothetical protein
MNFDWLLFGFIVYATMMLGSIVTNAVVATRNVRH